MRNYNTMQFGRLILASTLLIASCSPSFAYTHAHRGPTSSLFRRHAAPRSASKPAGQRAMDSERATQIQTALIKSGYMTGEPSGHWDAASESAMQKLQGDNGWQTKLTPDSRALIKLGLGPKSDTPAETAATYSTASAPQGASHTTSVAGLSLQQ